MAHRTGSGPITRKVLIVDSGLAGTGAAARRVRDLATELGTRNITVVEAASSEDGLATVVSDSSIHCILLNWTQGNNDSNSHDECTQLLRTVRTRNAKIPIFLMANRKVAGSLNVEV
ncbi:MAG: Orn/Lys/Arg decarboxylase N-terminal domain-containing protein, partial [Steroidobacteraceae bacterium]